MCKGEQMAGRRKAPAQDTENTHAAVIEQFFDLLGGEAGQIWANRVLNGEAAQVVRDLASTPAFERHFRIASTWGDVGKEVVAQDPAYVGMGMVDFTRPFNTFFEEHFVPRLRHRADGFRVIFENLAAFSAPLILETGCLRVPDNWEGDGQSTFQFDCYVRSCGGSVVSIDIGRNSVESARRACSSKTSLILNDSVAALNMLAGLGGRKAALVYLDSFDLDVNNPLPSATHHILELAAVRPLLAPGTIVCVDDYALDGYEPGGKGQIIDMFMDSIYAETLYSGYQKIWKMPA